MLAPFLGQYTFIHIYICSFQWESLWMTSWRSVVLIDAFVELFKLHEPDLSTWWSQEKLFTEAPPRHGGSVRLKHFWKNFTQQLWRLLKQSGWTWIWSANWLWCERTVDLKDALASVNRDEGGWSTVHVCAERRLVIHCTPFTILLIWFGELLCLYCPTWLLCSRKHDTRTSLLVVKVLKVGKNCNIFFRFY